MIKSTISAAALVVVGLLLPSAYAQACTTTITPALGIKPSIASGYAYAVVATGLTSPRGIEFDSQGKLLVVEEGLGVTLKTIGSTGTGATCASFSASKTLITDGSLTHGIALSADGATLFVSSGDAVYSYPYNAAAGTVGTRTTIVKGMENTGHISRTLVASKKSPGWLVVNRGSIDNIDTRANNIANGQAIVKAFNLASVPSGGYTYKTQGTVLGWGLRNEVGLVEHPTTGGIWGVENSGDNLQRNGVDVHTNNPGEELNYLGTVAAPSGANYGYPNCWTAWTPSELPNNANIQVGTQFSPTPSNDTACAALNAPYLTFPAHTAPLDIKFNNSNTEAWITYHGSWNRSPPIGYQVGFVGFSSSGMPTAARTSTTAVKYILGNADTTICPGRCLRPVGMAVDAARGRIFISSDSSGEIYVVARS